MQITTGFITMGTILFLSLSLLSAETNLSISESVPFQPSVMPEAKFPPGRLMNPLPASWKTISLDGTWRFKNIKNPPLYANPLNDIGMKNKFFDPACNDGTWENIKVPSSWYIKKPVAKLGWYRRTFDVPENVIRSGKRIILDFRRVGNEVDVWINGKKAGERKFGRFNSIRYDITKLITPGKNYMAVRVYDRIIVRKGYRYRHLGGIYEPVRLIIIPSDIYTRYIIVTPSLRNNNILINAEIYNMTGKNIQKDFVVLVKSPDGRQMKKSFPAVPLAKGLNSVKLGSVNIPEACLWSPDNPVLYTLYLNLKNGTNIGVTRFGFREFTVKGEWLYLNGKKFKPRMFTFSRIKNNRNSGMEVILRLLKSLNVNMLRRHSGEGVLPETFFNLCDNIGMPVYVDWSGLFFIKDFAKPELSVEDAVKQAWPPLERFIKEFYNHPSFCMLSLGNELYEGHNGHYFSEKLDALYGLIKKVDLQNRPVCSSTGRHTKNAIRRGILKERTDVLDDHQYRGASCGSWQDNITHIDEYAEAALKYYGKKPKINAEYGVPGDNLRYRACTFTKVAPIFELDPKIPEFKKKYIQILKSSQAEIGGYIRGKMNYCSPRQYIEETPCRLRYANYFFKRPVEIYRRAGVKCLGGHTNAMLYDLVRIGKGGNTRTFYGLPGPIPQKNVYFDMPLRFMVKRLYNPLLVTAGVFNEHPLTGSKQKIQIFVTNDLNESAEFKVVAQLRLTKGKIFPLAEINFGKIEAMSQKSEELQWTVPFVKIRVRATIELFLFKNGTRCGDNFYKITIIGNPSGEYAYTHAELIALYDAEKNIFRGLTSTSVSTSDILKKLKVPFEFIRDFKKLNKYKFLIVGRNSFDKNIIDSADRISQWVKNGGKLLCLEQSMCGRVSFFPSYSISAGTPSTFVTMSVPNHPVFRTLKQEDFDTWAGANGCLFKYFLSPLNEGLVAVAPTGAARDNESIKPVIADVKTGNGEIIFSQLDAVSRFNTDCVAAQYLRNLMNYFLTEGVSPFACKIHETELSKVIYVADKDAFFIDLKPFVNRSFTDDKANDGKGGWADFGAGFPGIPTGVTRLQGGVPFNIINSAENAGKSCLVLKGKKRPGFPEKVTGIPVNAKLNSVYFLHTSMYGEKGPVLKYVFHYTDGSSHTFVAKNPADLPDWWKAADKTNATVVFRKGKKGLYMSEFINPEPKKEIKSLDIISCNGPIPIVIAITGRKRFTSVVAGVGEE